MLNWVTMTEREMNEMFAELEAAKLEIERQRALVERATLFAQIVQRDSVNGSAYNKASTEWLKDVERGG